MSTIATLAEAGELRRLAPGDVLVAEGAAGGDLHILIEGRLTVERDGVALATISLPNAVIGEMSVLLGKPNSATVRAETGTEVCTIHNVRERLLQDAELSFSLAMLLASRLETTSALLVGLNKQHTGKTERGLLASILSALHEPADGGQVIQRQDLFERG